MEARVKKLEHSVEVLESGQSSLRSSLQVSDERMNGHIKIDELFHNTAKVEGERANQKLDSLNVLVSEIRTAMARQEGHSKGGKTALVVMGSIIGILQGLIAIILLFRG